MTLHLVKLCVGIESIEHLRAADAEELKALKAAGQTPELVHRTRQMPKRAEEILDGGSLYWVIRGAIQVRQPILALRPVTGADGQGYCDIVFARQLVMVRPTPRRAFQGWRYLEASDAPADLGAFGEGGGELPPSMRAALIELGLI
ncbi:MAG: DUF1489 domain-containing protein [Hyphomicrobiaceae bacterium]